MSLMTRFEQGAVRLGFLIEQVFSSKVQYSSACILVEGGRGGADAWSPTLLFMNCWLNTRVPKQYQRTVVPERHTKLLRCFDTFPQSGPKSGEILN